MGDGRAEIAGNERDLLAARVDPALPGGEASHPVVPAEIRHHAAVPALLAAPRPPWIVLLRSMAAAIRTAATRERLSAALRHAVEEEWERGTPFLLAPVFLCIGAVAYFSLQTEPGFPSLLAVFAVLTAAAFLVRHRPAAHVFSGMALISLGLLAGKVETWRADTKVLGSTVTTRIAGRVMAIEHQARGRVRLTIDLVETKRPKLRYAPARIRVSARSIGDGVKVGEGVEGVVRLMPPSGPVRPESYDFAFESYFDGIGASGFFLSAPQPVALQEPAPLSARLSAWLESLRNNLAGRIRESVGGPEGEIAAALITGVKAGIPEETNEAMRVSGLYHVLSISGLHLALVAATVMGSLRAMFALFPGFASRWPVKKYAAAAALLTVLFYLYVSGASVATQRSFLMLAIMLAALLFDRAALTMRNLAIAAIVIILLAPHEAVGPSFQMSFAATAALIAAYAVWSEHKLQRWNDTQPRSLWGRMVRKSGVYIGGIAATSLVAGAATALFAAWHFHRVAPLGLIANLAAMPAVSVLVMPFAVFAMVLMPFGQEQWPLWIMGQGVATMIAVAEWTAARSPFDTVGLVPAAAVVSFAAALVVLTMATTLLRIAAIPLLLAGILVAGTRDFPAALISEDGRLVGIPLSDGRLAINRSRPNTFTVENWQRAVMAQQVVKPRSGPALQMKRPAQASAGKQVKPFGDRGVQASGASSLENGFTCAETLCVARHATGAVIAHAGDAAAAVKACDAADLIVIDDATAKPSCGSAAIITKRDLARRGSATAIFVERDGKQQAEIAYAIDEPYRPWHAHRAFSREARGLPPYKRPDRKPGSSPAASAMREKAQ